MLLADGIFKEIIADGPPVILASCPLFLGTTSEIYFGNGTVLHETDYEEKFIS